MNRAAAARPLPPALRRHWRGRPRLLLEDGPALQLARLLPLQPDDRLLVLGRDAPLLAVELAHAAGLLQPPLAAIGRRPLVAATSRTQLDGNILRARADRLPLAGGSASVIVVPHLPHTWSDARLQRALEEAWRVLAHNGVLVLWEIAPSRSSRVNAIWRTWLSPAPGTDPQLRTFAQIGRAAYDAGFAWVQTLPLRPFLWPPGPRVAVLMRKERYTAKP